MSNSFESKRSEQKKDVMQKMQWCFDAIKYLNDNLEEEHPLYEPVNDAYWLVQIALKEMESLFRLEQKEFESALGTPTPRNE
jgi:hypothetical protein